MTEEQNTQLTNEADISAPVASNSKQGVLLGITILVIVAAGIFTGYSLSNKSAGQELINGGGVGSTEIGSKDTATFKDTASGVLEQGGVDGEGTHKLIREGGPSQTAYLTSSVIDLDGFVGKKVQVWGETNKGQKAGWFMDVGRIKVIE